jgi:DNA-directed RNA polymerase specialized sigma24 family protein
MNRRSFIENSAPDLYLIRIVYHHLSKWRRSGRKEMGVAYLEINKLPCLHDQIEES